MTEQRPKGILDQPRDAIRLKSHPYRTDQPYVGWINCCIYFHDVRHPSEIGAPEIVTFLAYLSIKENIVGFASNQALSTLMLFCHELGSRRTPGADAAITQLTALWAEPIKFQPVQYLDVLRALFQALTALDTLVRPLLFAQPAIEHLRMSLVTVHQQIVVDREHLGHVHSTGTGQAILAARAQDWRTTPYISPARGRPAITLPQ